MLPTKHGERAVTTSWPILNTNGHGAPIEPVKTAEIEVLNPIGPTPKRKRTKLADIRQIRSELGRVYRQVKNGEIDSGTGTRLAYMLDLMSRMIERSELEQRIEALEAERQK